MQVIRHHNEGVTVDPVHTVLVGEDTDQRAGCIKIGKNRGTVSRYAG